MAKYNMIYHPMGKDGFPDHDKWITAYSVNSAEEANKIIMNQMFFGHDYYAQDAETGEVYHGTTTGLRSLNSYT
jgi:hypothetical protein